MVRSAKDRLLVVSIDTEVDKGPDWRISKASTFRSVTEGVPDVLSPLFARYAAVPTYLVSAEVIEDEKASAVLASLGGTAELGTHLHPQFVEPQRELVPGNMAGRTADAVQRQYSRDIEAAKLKTLTEKFVERFQQRPTAFRSGRFGSSDHTLALLAELGYQVDSSVTPGLKWEYAEGVVDYRRWSCAPRTIGTAYGSIVELPISIIGGGPLVRWVQALPPLPRRVATRALGRRGSFQWLRPSWAKPGELVRHVNSSDQQVLVAMFHSMEVVPGASPYAADREGVGRIVASLEELLRRCVDTGTEMVGMTTAAERCRDVPPP
jgi:hypothetical protein